MSATWNNSKDFFGYLDILEEVFFRSSFTKVLLYYINDTSVSVCCLRVVIYIVLKSSQTLLPSSKILILLVRFLTLYKILTIC